MATTIKKSHKIIIPVIFLVYLVWWCLIAFANFPDSSLPIASNLTAYEKFDKIFFQRWGFFAPPPVDDERLYYVFKHNNDSTKNVSFEVFEALLKEKNRQYLLNDDLTNLDYILHNTISPIEDLLRDGYDVYKLNNNCLSKEDTCNYDNYINKTRSSFNNTPYIKTLVKHAEIIARRQQLDSNFKLQIMISLVALPKYAERFSKKARIEAPYFKSDIYNLKDKSWEKFTE